MALLVKIVSPDVYVKLYFFKINVAIIFTETDAVTTSITQGTLQ